MNVEYHDTYDVDPSYLRIYVKPTISWKIIRKIIKIKKHEDKFLMPHFWLNVIRPRAYNPKQKFLHGSETNINFEYQNCMQYDVLSEYWILTECDIAFELTQKRVKSVHRWKKKC